MMIFSHSNTVLHQRHTVYINIVVEYTFQLSTGGDHLEEEPSSSALTSLSDTAREGEGENHLLIDEHVDEASIEESFQIML